ncbi:MAG: membrane protein insertase YidC [Gammaproteobacteria bacterium]|nr:membrane protein insertase YidC [Gammaproteobacteria bacterium]
MENQRTFLIIALMAISAVLYSKWIEFSMPAPGTGAVQNATNTDQPTSLIPDGPDITEQADSIPSTPVSAVESAPVLEQQLTSLASNTQTIRVTTDLVIATINPLGGVIEKLELINEPVAIDKQDQGYPLLKNSPEEIFVAQDGLLVSDQTAPNHARTSYLAERFDYQLGSDDKVMVPLRWVAENGVQYTKTITFKKNSYVVEIDYSVNNNSSLPWEGYLYAQFSRTEPNLEGSSFGRLPSYTGGAIYTEQEKYEKVDFKDMGKADLAITTDSGWVAMLQHYFVGAWIPVNGGAKQFYSAVNNNQTNPKYRIGYKTLVPKRIAAGDTDTISTSVYLGSKEQSRLKKIQKESNINGLALTVDYGFLTFIADPLFVVLSWIHDAVGNWGWSIILLTILIKALFYPLSAASYKSMAGMKKLQPRIQTLKERYKDDKQKFQMEMMALYKKEKINPAGGCLPILVQIPVFIALYWVLLESVEIRQAPFALWLQDLSAPDPFYILPVLMGLSMWAQQKLNPAPMDDIQKKVMTIMPIALTFLFLTFPQGLVLYWVVNNVLSMAQQWLINRQHAV